MRNCLSPVCAKRNLLRQRPLWRREKGHKWSVEVAIRFQCPRSRPCPRNGRFPASKLAVVLPQGGHKLPLTHHIHPSS